MDVASLSRQIAVRHREDGHLRLELPAALAGPAARTHLEAGLYRRPGVYRVSFEPDGRRLSIRFEPQQCSLHEVAQHLRTLLVDLPAEAGGGAVPPRPAPLAAAQASIAEAGRQLNARVQRLLEGLRHAPSGSLQARLQPVFGGGLTEQSTINFLNDVLMFYLIKIHWDLITKRWMKDPLAHADAWLATFYLVFLLVRFRKAMAKAK